MDEIADPGRSQAVFFGASRFAADSGLADLVAVDENLVRLPELLREQRVWGLPEANVTVLGQEQLGSRDAESRVLDAVDAAAERADDLLVVYYAGHGLLDPEDQLLLALPGTRQGKVHTAMRYSALRGVLASAKHVPRKVLILDCCFAGAASGTPMGGGILPAIPSPAGAFLLSAAAPTATALCVPGERYSAFTGELITLLDRGLDADAPLLRMDVIAEHLDAELARKGRPRPWPDGRGRASGIVLAKNVAYKAPPRVAPPALTELAEAQKRADNAFPYRLDGAHRTRLEAVYVRQDMRRILTATSEAAEAPDAGDGAGRRDAASRAKAAASGSSQGPAVLLDDLLREQRNVVIVGGPGQGKTTSTLRLAVRLAEEWTTGLAEAEPATPGVLALRVAATSLAKAKGPWNQTIVEAAAAELGQTVDHALPTDLLDLAEPGMEWLVMVDGLDEITDPRLRRQVIGQLAERAREASRLRFLVTTRELSGGGLDALERAGMARYTLDPFDSEQVAAFARAWFEAEPEGERLAAGFLAGLEAAGPSDLLRVPLLATIAAILYQQHPDRPLPGNIYMLYEQYLGYLTEARAEPTARQWQDVRARVAAALDGDTTAADSLESRRSELVDHLALRSIEGEQDLLTAAVAWLDGHGGARARIRVPDWRDLVASMLDATGLFLHSPYLRFVHLSLAEHLAAAAMARSLPAVFDPEDTAWKKVLRLAAKDESLMCAVFVHHAHLRGGAEDLLAWLESGPLDKRLMTGRLLAEGVPAQACHVDRFLATARSLVRSDLRYGHRRLLRDALALAARLGDERAELTMLDIVADLDADISCRMDAAAALPRASRGRAIDMMVAQMADPAVLPLLPLDGIVALNMHDPVRAETLTTVLRGIMTAEGSSVEVRQAAAGAFAALGPSHADEAAQVLLPVLANAITGSIDRDLIGALKRLGPGYVDETARALRAFAADPRTELGTLLFTTEVLSPPYAVPVDVVADIFLAAMRAPSASIFERVEAAERLADLGPAHVAEAADHLLACLAHPTVDWYEIGRVANALTALGDEYAVRALDTIRAVLADPDTPASNRQEIGEVLAGFGAEYTEESAFALRSVISDESAGYDDRTEAANALAELGPRYAGEAAEAFRAWMRDRAVRASDRSTAAKSLAELSDKYDAEAADALRGLIADVGASASDRLHASAALLGITPGLASESALVQRSILADELIDPAVRTRAASQLAACGPEYSRESTGFLRGLMNATDIEPEFRLGAAVAFAALSSDHGDEAAAAMRALIGDPEVPCAQRLETAAGLAALGSRYAEESAAHELSIFGEPQVSQTDRLKAARQLRERGPRFLGAAAQALGEVMNDDGLNIFDRLDAAEALTELRGDKSPAALAFLIAATTTPVSDYRRRRAARQLAEVFKDHTSLGTEALLSIVADDIATAQDRIAAIESLAELGQGYAACVVDFVRACLRSPSLDPREKVVHAKLLAEVSPWHVIEAVEALRDAESDDALAAEDERIRLAEAWAATGRPGVRRAAEILRGIVADSTVSPADRLEAVEALGGIDRRFMHDAVAGWCALVQDVSAGRDLRVPQLDFALARPLTEDRATRQLQKLVTDPTASYAARLTAAGALAGLDESSIDEAAAALRALIADPGRTASDLLEDAQIISRLGPRCRADAVSVLRALIADEGLSHDERRWPGLALLNLNAQYAPEIARMLGGLCRDVDADGETRMLDAHALALSGPAYEAEGVAVLRAIATEPSHSAEHRRDAAARWSSIGPLHEAPAAEAMLAILSEPSTGATDRWKTVAALARLDRTYVQTAAETLRSIMADDGASGFDRRWSAVVLAGLASVYVDEATQALRRMIADPGLDAAFERTWSALALTRLGSGNITEAVRVLSEVISSPSTDERVRDEAVDGLTALGPRYREAAAEALRALIDAAETSKPDAVTAAVRLHHLGPGYEREAIDVLRAAYADQTATVTDRWSAVIALATLVPEFAAEALRLAREVITDSAASPAEGTRALVSLRALSGADVPESALTLRSPAEDEAGSRPDPLTLTVITDESTRLDPTYANEDAAALRALITDPRTDPAALREAALSLARFEPEGGDQAINTLRDVVADPDSAAGARHEAELTLARLSRRSADEANLAAQDVIADTFTLTAVRAEIGGLRTAVARLAAVTDPAT